jgi:hypothetical protein
MRSAPRRFLALIAGSVAPFAARAQVTIDTGIGSTFGIGSTDLRSTVINIVNYVLGLLGLIAVVTIIASVIIIGVAGGTDRAAKARQALFAAIIGLVVVLLAWAIVIFVVGTTTNVTA